MTLVLSNGRILTPAGVVEGKALAIGDGRIHAVLEAADAPVGARRYDLGGGLLVPGFIDTQVNGGGGVLFNDDTSVEAIAAIGAAHRAYGTTGFLPTLISDDLSVVDAAMRAVEQAIQARVPGVLGIHIEGPFLNPIRKGIHDAGKFRVLDDEAVALLSSLTRGKTLVTLAPETTTPQMIRRLTQAGVIVAGGHSNADYAVVRQALEAGLTGFTHLFNAMSPLTSRKPGMVGAALESKTAWCGLIVDGRHVDPVTLRLALATRPLDRFMLVTDAMPTVGMVDKRFDLQGRAIRVENGVCVDAEGTLAGCDLDMISTVRNATTMLGLSIEDAVAIASRSPAAFLGLADERGAIVPGLAADLVLLNEALDVQETWIGGISSSDAAAAGSAARRGSPPCACGARASRAGSSIGSASILPN